ncbi:hypothetical protein CW745_11285 [Psychromonas sp. psych-6C06]|uniref:hypothetical protein n=1 Tax=Psychromonas sp. psych-6C06 TaxID=2058089 RepID=UPI000C3387E4|nr:hypothetical protein [Psychromonas sp. psych-6C06]PKF61209.1 hypothetical protein CW745_11285 [Psychromonas sp. psych-6C06]
MLDAICVIDENSEKVFSIFEFKTLPESEIDRLRYTLSCPVCRQKAYFRKASRDGKQACFGSRYHLPDCAEFNPSKRKSEEEKQVAEVENLLLEGDALQIDFSAPISKKRDTESSVTASIKTTPALSTVKQQAEIRVNKQGLKKLLVSLLRGSSLATSDVWVYTSETHKWRAKNLFIHVNDAQPTDNGAPRMYWGTIADADKTLNWLNPAEERTVSIPISKYRQALLSRFDIQEPRDLEGAGFIIFAKCIQSKDKKRKFLQLWSNDVQYFYVSKAQEQE